MLVEGPAELFLIPALLNRVRNIDLDRDGVSVIPIYGVHFDVYAKLFSGTGLCKKCAIITDGDFEPSDAMPNLAGEDDLPARPDLKLLENDYVRVFSCVTTFERALVSEGSLEMLASAAADIGAPNVAKKLRKGIEDLAVPGLRDDDRQKILTPLRETVLNTAKRFGKARFAQIVARHVGKATQIPKYLVDAVTWLAAP
jgi:putative ATP-dependent endonuclease of OLD family